MTHQQYSDRQAAALIKLDKRFGKALTRAPRGGESPVARKVRLHENILRRIDTFERAGLLVPGPQRWVIRGLRGSVEEKLMLARMHLKIERGDF